jgi:hypothetical protein
MRRLLVLCGIACALGCGGSAQEGVDARALMAPGQDCTRCHPYSAAGTLFTETGAAAPGAVVVIGGVTATTNAAGNFFTATPIAFPAAPEIRSGGAVRRMPELAPGGGCNGCHGVGSISRMTLP